MPNTLQTLDTARQRRRVYYLRRQRSVYNDDDDDNDRSLGWLQKAQALLRLLDGSRWVRLRFRGYGRMETTWEERGANGKCLKRIVCKGTHQMPAYIKCVHRVQCIWNGAITWSTITWKWFIPTGFQARWHAAKPLCTRPWVYVPCGWKAWIEVGAERSAH